ncbi:alpha-L-rhamnosidase [Echinicola vietnamensis]|uniref:alpha-L-rhamnosidase n=1 Tax=Echinicola vietnamensis (strain DSM 17526 / LMG 23754 / KMM 6221) TaxID=926556 RepID=L0FTF0_ECHVK|nr:alpha-L-rhamnosidase [Echinicola vietnamensis]AGA77189.1 glycogen debranching enzyme [Echinicola vietnamensis DSM 17526]
MKRLTTLILLFFTMISVAISHPDQDIAVDHLKVEMLTNPAGIDVENPRLSWEIITETPSTYQQAYQVLVASDPSLLSPDKADLWNSGKVDAEESTNIRYAGEELDKDTKVYWKVKVWTNHGESDWSERAHWILGLRYYKDWKGRWIGFDRAFPWEEVSTFPTLGARYFRDEFDIKKTVERATVYIMGLGLYELHLNGQKVGDAVLAPTPTDYTQNVKYNAYEVTDLLQENGANAVGVMLGNGRYFTMRQHYKPYKIKNFGFPKLLFNLIIHYTDGSTEVISTSDQWKGTADGPIRNNNEYDGEYYDANKEFIGWDQVGFDDSAWLQAEYVQEPVGDYEAQMNENMKVMQDVAPVSLEAIGQDRYVLDMGQNMVGWLQMTVKGKKGDTVKLKFAESLQENGELFMTNLRDAKVTDTYVLKNEEKVTWEPRFTYHGFRFVEISGYPGEPKIEDFMGKMVYDDIKTIGHFETSDPMLNHIYQNAWWGIAGNYKGMPVDCPQRNERQPWLGDRAVGAHGESYMFDNVRLYKKWLDDIRLAQKADGALPDVAPAYWRYYSDNMTWPGTYLMIADMLYQQTGDTSVIRENYPAMKKWLGYMADRYMTEDYIVTEDSYGDWVVPPPSIEAGTGQNADVKRPSALISTAYYYHFMEVMSRFATILGKHEEIPSYQSLKEKVHEGFHEEFYHQGFYGDNKMTDNLLPLAFGMVPEDDRQRVFDQVVETIQIKNNGHLSTGLIGTQWLMRTLSDYGRADLALKLATNTTFPSWGYMIENGATTIWELWHGNVAKPTMNSQNHTMLLGDLTVWFYEYLAGIKAGADSPGFKVFELAPVFVEGLDSVKASFDSPYGAIGSHWERKGEQITWKIKVPANTTAIVKMPISATGGILMNGEALRSGDMEVKLGSGEYELVF